MTREQAEQYYENKRQEVLKEIKPLLTGFMGIDENNYDYLVEFKNETTTHPSEYLRIKEQKIGCTANSVSAVVEEAFGYCFVKYYARVRYIGRYRKHTLEIIKQYWIKEGGSYGK